MTAEQANGWCFGCNNPATVIQGERERRCGGAGCNGLVRRVLNQPALDVGLLAHRMAQGHYAHAAAMTIASHPDAKALSPPSQPGHPAPVGHVKRKDGSVHTFNFNHYLEQIRSNRLISEDLDRVWIAGAYLVVGDALSCHGYFQHVPELELIRHVRNGIAHGNRFHFTKDGLERLAKHPAHNRLAYVRDGGLLEISPALQGQRVLFDFAGPADFLDVLMSAEIYLVRLGVGDSPRDYVKGNG